jgi:predicted membrane-bound spermidine synthase
VVAALAAAAAVCFAEPQTRLRRSAVLTAAALLALGMGNLVAGGYGKPFIRLWWVKGAWERMAQFERWNSFSRIRVENDVYMEPKGWGLSPDYPKDARVEQLYLNIDANAGTYLTKFDGNLQTVEFLKHDVTNVAHYIRPKADVLVVGVGGGRDVLSALAFGQQSVTGVEINGQIIGAVTQRFGDFTGHLDQRPGVHLVNDEARSFIARSQDRYDIIQISLIDTWAATAAGAYVLSENSLYTLDAWDVFLQHLKENGVLSVSRWYYNNRPGETWRVISLANAALRNLGATAPEKHILVVKSPLSENQVDSDLPDAVATVMVSGAPFTAEDVARIGELAKAMRFDVVLSPTAGTEQSPALRELAASHDLAATTANMPLNLMPPTDNQPFFFNMARFRDILTGDLWRSHTFRVNLTAVAVLGSLLAFVTVLATALIVVPVAWRSQLRTVASQSSLSLYFLAIGVAFMLVEISQMQRLVVLLGHPTYSLSVVLFSLLISSGIGSYTTANLRGDVRRATLLRLALLLVVLTILGVVTPGLVHTCQASSTPARIALAIALLGPAGFFMGMAFPLGMRLAAQSGEDIKAWLWSINGAASIVASVLAVVVAMAWGISTAWWLGVGCYAFALTMAASRRHSCEAMPVGADQMAAQN